MNDRRVVGQQSCANTRCRKPFMKPGPITLTTHTFEYRFCCIFCVAETIKTMARNLELEAWALAEEGKR